MLIVNAILARQDKDQPAFIREDAFLTAQGRISEIGSSGVLRAQHPQEPVLDAKGRLLMPGLINAHARMSRILARGLPLPGPDTLASASELGAFWRRYAQALDYDAIRYSTLLACLEAIRYGTTLVFDLLSAPNAQRYALDAVAEAALQCGLRVNASLMVEDRDGASIGRLAVDENIRFAAQAAGQPLLSTSMGLDACQRLTDSTLAYAVGAAAISRLGFHSSIGETLYAGRDCASKYGFSQAARLRRWGVLGGRTLLTDGVYLSLEDRDMLKSSGAWLVHLPRSNTIAGVGLAPVADYIDRGMRLCLGTEDSSMDLRAEATAGVHAQLQDKPQPQERIFSLFGAALLDVNAEMAAAILNDLVGTLRPGALADFILLDCYGSLPQDATMLRRQLMLGGTNFNVNTVVVHGQVLYQNGEYKTVEEQRIVAHAREITTALWKRLS